MIFKYFVKEEESEFRDSNGFVGWNKMYCTSKMITNDYIESKP
jgi:hypothetical protein